MMQDEQEKYFNQIDSRQNWPYATDYLLDTLDPELIEAHGEQILSRALNIGRTVGFIGAGVAMSYGRISWQTLVEAELGRVEAKLEEAKAHKDWHGPKASDARRIAQTLRTLKLPRSDVRSERYPMLFQISEQLDRALNKFVPSLRDAPGLRSHAAKLTIDDVGHAYQILMDGLCYGQKVIKATSRTPVRRASEIYARAFINKVLSGRLDVSLLERAYDVGGSENRELSTPFQPVDHTAYRLFFETRNVRELLAIVRKRYARNASTATRALLDAVGRTVERACGDRPAPIRKGGNRTQTYQYLLPTDRYLVGVLLHLAPSAGEKWRVPAVAWWQKIARQIARFPATALKPEVATTTRHGQVTQWRDPLLFMQERLQISRFITTNFDHEIERMFRDQAFRHDGKGEESTSLLRPSFDEIDFDNTRSGDLTAFAVRDRGRSGAVIHLHGRAERNAGENDSSIVVTENDYQRRYLRDEPSRRLVDDAIRLSFGGNPILFVGSNMGEDDLLRPLRQFMSGAARVEDRVAIALVPAMSDRARRTEDKIAALARYGVYEIHFGNCRFESKEILAERKSATEGEVEWLAWFWSLRGSARDILKILSGEKTLASMELAGLRDALDRAWNDLLKTYIEGPELSPAAARELQKFVAEEAERSRRAAAGTKRRKFAKSSSADLQLLTEAECRQRALARADVNLSERLAKQKILLNVPTEIEGQLVRTSAGAETNANAVDIRVEVDILNTVIRWFQDILPRTSRDMKKKSWKSPWQREAQALRLALDGAGDSALSIYTCARLFKVKSDWDSWKTRWFELPKSAKVLHVEKTKPALTRENNGKFDVVASNPIVIHRHAVRMPARPNSDPRLGRFYRGAPSQSTYGLIDALKSGDAHDFLTARGRRFLILSSRRGLGKGHFFSSIADCEGPSRKTGRHGARQEDEPRVLEFLRSLVAKDEPQPPQWVALSFLSFGFSQEVMSAFDRTIEVLFSCLKQPRINPRLADAIDFDNLKHDRIERFRAVLGAWSQHGKNEPDNAYRVLVAFNGFSVFFDRDGQAKNGQVKRLCDLMFDDEYRFAPIDFVMQCQNDRLPAALIAEARKPAVPLMEQVRDSKGRVRAERALLAAGIRTSPAPDPPNIITEISWENRDPNTPEQSWRTLKIRTHQDDKQGKALVRRPAAAIYILREARAIVIAATYFPRVPILIARSFLRSGTGPEMPKSVARILKEMKEYPIIFGPTASTSSDAMRRALDQLRSSSKKILSKHFSPTCMAVLAMILEFGNITEEDVTVVDLIEKLQENIEREPPRRPGEAEGIECIRAAQALLRSEIAKPVVRYLVRRLPSLVAELNKYMRDLFHAVDGGRFLLTLILSAAYESTSGLSRQRQPRKAKRNDLGRKKTEVPLSIDVVNTATDSIRRVLDTIKLSLMGAPVEGRSNVVIEEVLSSMRRRSERNDPLPLTLDWRERIYLPRVTRGKLWDGTPPALKPLLYKLMVEIIWHLAIIGQPVERAVLELCPRIKAVCDEITKQKWNGISITTRTCVREVLALATNRCLVYSLRHHGSVPEGEARNEFGERYEEEYARYAVHRLVQRYVFRSLGASDVEFSDADQFTLSLYGSQPDELPRLTWEAHRQISEVITSLSGYPGSEAAAFAELNPRVKQKLLRASLGIMRSIYSVAVLSRFDRKSDRLGTIREGYFEEHRRRIRWLLRASVDITATSDQFAPFYAEEIVWLYNECAVLSTVEGRLSDAHALFGRALAAAKKIEPDVTGPLHVRVLLNKSICDIERGHNVEARSVLTRIAEIADEHPVPPLLATGYIGLIDHLAGDVAEAQRNYSKAIDGLAKLSRSRGASIFSRHYGDLLGGLRQPKLEEGRQRVEDAIHFAQEGGHEDIRYLALLSLAKMRIKHPVWRDGAAIHKELNAIENYAHIVGMPRLLCEVGLTRARLLLHQGETERAGTLVNESLEIASMNDLRVRKVSGLLLLAEINLKRNQPAAARPLLELGMSMAKAANTHFSLTHAQAIEHQLEAAASSATVAAGPP